MAVQHVVAHPESERPIHIETGKIALQANGSVVVRQGDTMVLVAVCMADPRPGLDFFPLQVDYRERFSAAGKFPGGYFKREGRPTEKEILTSRMTDRPLRPLFPKGFINDVQIMSQLLSADGINEPDTLSMLGASAALMVSDIPFAGPVGALRVARIDGEFVANPTTEQMHNSDLDLVYAGVEGKTIMIEGSADEIAEEVLRDALVFADRLVSEQVAAQKELAARVNKPKATPTVLTVPDEVQAAVDELCTPRFDAVGPIDDKKARMEAFAEIANEAVEALGERFADPDTGDTSAIGRAVDNLSQKWIRNRILETAQRSDGRGPEDIRKIDCEVGILPRTHGSSLFTRGETQALVSITLGSVGDAQECDVLTGSENPKKRFILHYNFPNFSVGETGRIMGPGRREIGHGALAERSVAPVIPDDFPYTVRCVSDILGSNGSSSMASVCGATLALMDAGVPMKRPVAGISCGLVTGEDDAYVLLTDILGSEDHYGDMDFKIAGTRDGITGFQLDLKIAGLPIDRMFEAMQRLLTARISILDTMDRCIADPRSELSRFAPQMRVMKINPDKIGALIGPGGKNIKGITESTGAQIDIEDDGTVSVFAADAETLERAAHAVDSLTAEVEVGKIYRGLVKTVKDFGAFVEVLPGQEGLLHISEMADYRVDKVEDICNVGDKVTVKVIAVDDRGKIRLSRKAALGEDADASKPVARQADAPVAEVELGKVYRGLVKAVKDFGAFVEVVPGREGLLHISEMADYRVDKVEDICEVGDKVTVKVIDMDDQGKGKLRLSRKAALAEID